MLLIMDVRLSLPNFAEHFAASITKSRDTYGGDENAPSRHLMQAVGYMQDDLCVKHFAEKTARYAWSETRGSQSSLRPSRIFCV